MKSHHRPHTHSARIPKPKKFPWYDDPIGRTTTVAIQLMGDEMFGKPSPTFSQHEATALYDSLLGVIPWFPAHYEKVAGESLTPEIVWLRYRRAYVFLREDVDEDIEACNREYGSQQPELVSLGI
jgi:hypothetical protein